MDIDTASPELCYVCTLPIERMQNVLVLKDDEGHLWFVHKACQDGLVNVDDSQAS